MPSHDETRTVTASTESALVSATAPHGARARFELGARVVAVMCLLSAVWLFVQGHRMPASRGGATRPLMVADSLWVSTDIRTALTPLRAALIAQHVGDTLAARLPLVPAGPQRAALQSVRAAGVPLVWNDATYARDLALSAQTEAGPNAGIIVRASLPTGVSPERFPVVLRDVGGVLDSLTGATPAAIQSWRVASVVAPVRVSVGRSVARAPVDAAAPPRRLLVMGLPGWESKFAVAALEELGWVIDGAFRVSPSGVVQTGDPMTFDTARYAAVVVVDSMPLDANAMTAFVRAGGGLVLSGDAIRIPSLARLRPATASYVRGAVAGALLTESPRRGLEAWELAPTRNAVVLQQDVGDHGADTGGTGRASSAPHAEAVVVAHRVGAGRVVAQAYRETWRWRMQGTDDGALQHRQWWRALLASATGTSPIGSSLAPPHAPGDAAPYADLVARVGAARTTDSGTDSLARSATLVAPSVPEPADNRTALLFVVATGALLLEWASRRLRGQR